MKTYTMHRLSSLVIALCLYLIPVPAVAQSYGYACITTGAGMLFYAPGNNKLQVSFPYTVTDASGQTTQHTFTSNAINPYSSPEVMWCPPFNLEFGGKRWLVNFRLYVATGMADFSLGYGRNYYFDLFRPKRNDIFKKTFVFKPSINISYNHYSDNNKSGKNYLGTISNDSNTVHLLNQSSGPTFSWSASDQNNSDNTQTLDLYYVQNEFAVVPRLAVAINQLKHIMHVEISAAYYLPFYEIAGIKIYHNDWETLNHNAIKINAPDVTATFNNRKITSAPYRFSGVFVSVTAGVSMSFLKARKQPRL